ncbi:hypothetical protein BN1708_016930, partial [Verticillium longisporum]
MLDVIRRAVDHCPWSGALWSRYILSAEEARLPFHDIEQIKHKATSHPDLYKNGMTALLDMYAGWCGFLKRTAMDLNASDEAVDIADMGLQAAIEFVDQAKNRYGDEYRGDPAFRLERIYIQHENYLQVLSSEHELFQHDKKKVAVNGSFVHLVEYQMRHFSKIVRALKHAHNDTRRGEH